MTDTQSSCSLSSLNCGTSLSVLRSRPETCFEMMFVMIWGYTSKMEENQIELNRG